MISKASKVAFLKVAFLKPCSIPKSKVVSGKPLRKEKSVVFKNKRPHNLETLK